MITRSGFESNCKNYFELCWGIKKIIEEAKTPIGGRLMISDTSLIPSLKTMIKESTGIDPVLYEYPLLAVSRGASNYNS